PDRRARSKGETKKLFYRAYKRSRVPPPQKTASKATMESQTHARPFDETQQTAAPWSTTKKRERLDTGGRWHATKFPGAPAHSPSSSQASGTLPRANNCKQGSGHQSKSTQNIKGDDW